MLKQKTRDMFRKALEDHAKPLWTRSGPRMLTAREIIIIGMLVVGFSYDEIGRRFDITTYRAKQIANRVRRSIVRTNMREATESAVADSINDSTSIDELGMTTRTTNCLKCLKVYCVGDLVHKTESEILMAPSAGRKSLNEIKEILRTHNRTLHA